MDYSMFSRPKLHDAKGTRYYPEYEFPVDQNYHHPNHHSHSVVLNEDVEIQSAATRRKHRSQRGTSMRPRCTSEKKCPIYVHPIPPAPESFEYNHNISHSTYRKVTNYLNDLQHVEQEPNISTRSQKVSSSVRRSSDKSKKAVLTKLEESYWANWKPTKEASHDSYSDRSSLPKNARNKAQGKKQKCKTKKPACDRELMATAVSYNRPGSPNIITHMAAKDGSALPIIDEERSRGMGNDCGDDPNMQVDPPCDVSPEFNLSLDSRHQNDETKKTEVLFASPGQRQAVQELKTPDDSEGSIAIPVNGSASSEMIERAAREEVNRLKHTDSLILTKNKKQSEERRSYQQPKCIRLYKKPGPSTTAGLVRGGTYPLKSCLKKESSFGGKRNIRLGRPGSPLIVTSNYYNNFPRSFRK